MRYRATVIAAVLVLAALAAAFALVAAGSGSSDAGSLRAIVHDADGNTHELPLSEDTELAVSTSLGSNTVVVKDGAVSIADADCPGGDCTRQQALDEPGRQLICLPHRLWVEVAEAGSAGTGLDVSAASPEASEVDLVAR